MSKTTFYYLILYNICMTLFCIM